MTIQAARVVARGVEHKPYMSKWGFMLYPVRNSKGQLLWVCDPQRYVTGTSVTQCRVQSLPVQERKAS